MEKNTSNKEIIKQQNDNNKKLYKEEHIYDYPLYTINETIDENNYINDFEDFTITTENIYLSFDIEQQQQEQQSREKMDENYENQIKTNNSINSINMESLGKSNEQIINNDVKMNNNKNNTIFDKFRNKINSNRSHINRLLYSIVHVIVISYFAYATYFFIHEQNSNIIKICNNTNFENESCIVLNNTINNNNNNNSSSTNGRCYGACGIQWCHGYGLLLIIFIAFYFGLIYNSYLKTFLAKFLYRRNIRKFCSKIFKKCYIIIIILILIGLGVFLYFDVKGSEERLMSLISPIIFIIFGYIFSTDRKKINWKTVIIGISLQFGLGLFCIKWEIGRKIFQCIGDKLSIFLPLSNEGGKFVYGVNLINEQIFAFSTIPVIYFFSCLISILYYYNIMQCIVLNIGWLLQNLLDTTVCESVNSAGNIFLGMSESPLLIRPYIKYLTKSEIHAIMVSGFATVAGTVFAAYMSFGANPAHLITSTVMAAPAALAFSKLYYPECEESKTRSDNIELKKSEDSSAMDAATNGAQSATAIILGIIANLIAFIALIALLNNLVNWFGYLIGLDYLTFEWIFSKLFIPLCWCLGVPLKDCNVIAQVIAKKTVINEFVAFKQLGEFRDAGKISSVRSVGIATFAICGFANPSSLGIYIGLLTSLCPTQRKNITEVALRSCIVGSIVCFVSAGFAGLLMDDDTLHSLSRN